MNFWMRVAKRPAIKLITDFATLSKKTARQDKRSRGAGNPLVIIGLSAEAEKTTLL